MPPREPTLFHRLLHGEPLVRSLPAKAALLLALAAAVFFAPYLFPVPPSISLSYVLQYSNRAALLLFTGGALLYALLTAGCMGRADTVDRPLPLFHLLVALPLIFVFTAGQALRSLSYSAGIESFYSINRSVLLLDGVRPFTGFSSTYGPLELYPPVWLHALTGRPLTTTYYAWLIAQWLLGTAILWFTVRHLPLRQRWRPLLFWVLLALCLLAMPADGATYNPVRLIGAAFAAVAIARTHDRGQSPILTSATALLLVALDIGISVDLGLAVSAGTLLWFGVLLWQRRLSLAQLLLFVAGSAAIILYSRHAGYFIAAAMFGAGAYNLPLLPTTHIALTLFVYVAAACAAVAAWRTRDFDSAVLPMAFIGLAGLPGAFGRADEIHLRMASAAFLLGLAYIQQQVTVRRGWTALATVFYLWPALFGVADLSRHQAGVFAHFVLHHHVSHPFAITMQGEPAMQGMATRYHWPLFAATAGSLQLHQPCPVVYFAPSLTPPRGVAPSAVCVDTGAYKVAGNLFTTAAIQFKVDELLRQPRRPLLLLDAPLEDQFPTIEDDPAILPRVEGPSYFHPAVKRAPLTYQPIIDAIVQNYTPAATAENGFRVWQPK